MEKKGIPADCAVDFLVHETDLMLLSRKIVSEFGLFIRIWCVNKAHNKTEIELKLVQLYLQLLAFSNGILQLKNHRKHSRDRCLKEEIGTVLK